MLRIMTGLLAIAGVMSEPVGAAAQSPEELVQSTADKVLTVLQTEAKKKERDPKVLYRLVDEVILPVVDLEGMSKLILAKHWRTATPEQRQRFMVAYRDMMVRTYTLSMLDYADTTYKILPARGKSGEKYVTVYTELLPGQGRAKIAVDYRLRRVEGEWRVFDVVIDGISLVKNYRTSFGEEITRAGLDALILRMEDKTSEPPPMQKPVAAESAK